MPLCTLNVSLQLLKSTINKKVASAIHPMKENLQNSTARTERRIQHSAAKKKRHPRCRKSKEEKKEIQVLQAPKLQKFRTTVIHAPFKPINLRKRRQNEKDNKKNNKRGGLHWRQRDQRLLTWNIQRRPRVQANAGK